MLETGNLRLTLSSRVAALGTGGHAAAALLLGEGSIGSVSRHEGLVVAHLGPEQLAHRVAKADDYPAAVSEVMLCRPHVVVLDEALESGDSSWASFFASALRSEFLKGFGGALVVRATTESTNLSMVCSERWSSCASGRVQQDTYLQIIENALDTLRPEEHAVLEEALAVDYCAIGLWIGKARELSGSATLFTGVSAEGKRDFRGFMCHHMVPQRAEFHIKFIFVPREHRRKGYGAQIVQWAIDRAARMPQSKCRWISLEAGEDELVPWYEGFGFTDMTCGPDPNVDESERLTWMELRNESVVAEEDGELSAE